VGAALAYSIARSGHDTVTSAFNDFTWVAAVVASFPMAMLVMAGSFGLWRAVMISNTAFTAGVTVVLLVLAGTTTWARNGFWAADGAYSHYVVPFLALAWVTAASGFLTRQLGSAREPQAAAVSQF
jgi:hypothetical protein